MGKIGFHNESLWGVETNKNFINGLNLGWISASQIKIQIGVAADDANSVVLNSLSEITLDVTISGINGLDTGVEAANTWYFAWLIRNSSTGAVAGLLSVSSSSPVLPSGYTEKRLLGAVKNDVSSNFLKFFHEGKNSSRKIIYLEDMDSVLKILAGGSNTVYTDVDFSSLVPPISRRVYTMLDCGGAQKGYFRPNGESMPYWHVVNSGMGFMCESVLDANQLGEYRVDAGGSLDIMLMGYWEEM